MRALITLLATLWAACSTEVYSGLSERQANQALVALREAGLAADKQLDQRGGVGRPATFSLLVGKGDETQALRFLATEGLPRAALPGELAGKGLGPLALPSEQRAAQALELSGALQQTLEGLPGVVEARVHLALPDEDPLHPAAGGSEHPARPTASVLLRLRGPPPLQPGEIERLVARAVSGLDAADVSVISTQAGPRQALSPPALVQVGPLLVAPGSQRLASGLLALLFILAAALCASLYFAVSRSM